MRDMRYGENNHCAMLNKTVRIITDTRFMDPIKLKMTVKKRVERAISAARVPIMDMRSFVRFIPQSTLMKINPSRICLDIWVRGRKPEKSWISEMSK